MRQEAMVKVHEPQECTQFTLCVWKGKLPNDLYLVLEWLNAVLVE